MKDRVVVLQRVVAVVIAERALRPAHARRHLADQRELGVRDERMRPTGLAASFSRSPAMSDASISSGTFSGSGAIADEDQRRRPAEKHRHRQRLAPRLGDLIVEAAALADLPVHAGGARDRARAGGTCRGCGRGRRDAA